MTETSLSITDHAANLHLLSEPLIPDEILFDTDPARLLDLTQIYQDCVPPQGPVPSVVPPPAVLSRDGPLYASIEPTATGGHPLISTGLTVCPYRMTTYCDNDISSVDTYFGVQIHHPRFLVCVGAPESAWLLGRPPAEWLQVMDRRDALIAAVQLQRDAVLMASKLTVLNQYVVALHRMSTEVLQCEHFPSRAVDDAAPVPRILWASTQMAAMGIWHPCLALYRFILNLELLQCCIYV